MRDLQYMIDVMTAARDGKTVQVKNYKHEWEDVRVVSNISWNWGLEGCDWRIAPEPRKVREWVLGLRPDGSVFETFPEGAFGAPMVRVREVLPEETK